VCKKPRISAGPEASEAFCIITRTRACVRAIRPIWGLTSDASEVADSPDFAVARTFDRNPNQGVNDVTKRELSQELQTAGFLLDEGPTGRFRILHLHAGDHSRHSTSDPTPSDHRQNNPLRRGVKWQQH